MFYLLKLADRVDRAAPAHEDDTLQTKAVLKALGHYKTPEYGMTPYPDEPLFDGIKAYQEANNLKVDGVMKPGGETEKSINERVEAAQAAERERHGARARRKERRVRKPEGAPAKSCPNGQYPANERICLPFTGVCMDNWVCRPYPAGGGSRG
ncbi:MAG: peptidoglycan-binding domain-containing protein [Rhodospirillales bacterium]